MLGVLPLDKTLGGTSHDVVATIRRRLGLRRVGHAGTLDPLGTGLLVVAVGPATRFLQFLPLEPKEYLAEVEFGSATTTYDKEGEVSFSGDLPADFNKRLDQVVEQHLGLIEQLPPMYSAVKVNGRALYDYARKGQEIERTPRRVHIGEVEVLGIEGNVAKMRIVCSGGTYIRTLAHDMGQSMGCGAHLASLRRTQVGKFRIEQAVPVDSVTAEDLIPLRQALHPMPMIQLVPEQVRMVREGRQLRLIAPAESKHVGLLDEFGEVFSVARYQAGVAQPECVIPKLDEVVDA
ncbi:MAG: tRNA pseudouridine(55) synthase TruB [Armatimonadetes bacterium]|nr:tRNA pseudouridine(55) synthase TruB [Armatimonadota bacterium]